MGDCMFLLLKLDWKSDICLLFFIRPMSLSDLFCLMINLDCVNRTLHVPLRLFLDRLPQRIDQMVNRRWLLLDHFVQRDLLYP